MSIQIFNNVEDSFAFSACIKDLMGAYLFNIDGTLLETVIETGTTSLFCILLILLYQYSTILLSSLKKVIIFLGLLVSSLFLFPIVIPIFIYQYLIIGKSPTAPIIKDVAMLERVTTHTTNQFTPNSIYRKNIPGKPHSSTPRSYLSNAEEPGLDIDTDDALVKLLDPGHVLGRYSRHV